MKFQYIIEEIEKFAPPHLSEEWDNVGLMVGGKDMEIKTAMVVLDITEDAVKFAIQNGIDLIVSHHPFIMPKISAVDFGTKKGELIKALIKNDVCVYSMHTNFDSCDGGVNDALSELFNLTDVVSDGMVRKGLLEKVMTLREFMELVKKTLNVRNLTYCGEEDKKIRKIAVCGGSGGSFIGNCFDCDVLLTGEAKYHEYQFATENGFSVVCAGHFETENATLYKIREFLKNLGITVKDGDVHRSFCKNA